MVPQSSPPAHLYLQPFESCLNLLSGIVHRASMNDRDYVRDMQHKNVNALLRYLNTKSPILHLSILMDISSLINTASASSQKDEANGVVIEDDVLFNAIDSATLHRVQTVLREICTENPEAFSLACEKLLVGHEDSTATDTDTDTDTEAKDDGGPGTKRKRDTMQHRYKICTQCDEEYDILDNPEDACEWHPGTFPEYLSRLTSWLIHLLQVRLKLITRAVSGMTMTKDVTGL